MGRSKSYGRVRYYRNSTKRSIFSRTARLPRVFARVVGIIRAVFLRFVTTRIDQHSHRPQGVFVAGHSLLHSGTLNSDECTRLRDILEWFNTNLPHPPKSFVTGRTI